VFILRVQVHSNKKWKKFRVPSQLCFKVLIAKGHCLKVPIPVFLILLRVNNELKGMQLLVTTLKFLSKHTPNQPPSDLCSDKLEEIIHSLLIHTNEWSRYLSRPENSTLKQTFPQIPSSAWLNKPRKANLARTSKTHSTASYTPIPLGMSTKGSFHTWDPTNVDGYGKNGLRASGHGIHFNNWQETSLTHEKKIDHEFYVNYRGY
jgi:hypothetical protein